MHVFITLKTLNIVVINYNCTVRLHIIIIIIDGPDVLGITDLEEVQESVKEIVEWKDLGLKLGLFYSTLEEIELDHNRNKNRKREMLAAWLKGEDNSKDRTWSTLVEVVHKVNNHSLAEEIAKQHLK